MWTSPSSDLIHFSPSYFLLVQFLIQGVLMYLVCWVRSTDTLLRRIIEMISIPRREEKGLPGDIASTFCTASVKRGDISPLYCFWYTGISLERSGRLKFISLVLSSLLTLVPYFPSRVLSLFSSSWFRYQSDLLLVQSINLYWVLVHARHFTGSFSLR